MKQDLKHKLDKVFLPDLYTYLTGKKLKFTDSTITGHCPFDDHTDEVPSFQVFLGNPNTFFCWGCGRSGNAVNLVRTIKYMEFYEACRFLNSIKIPSYYSTESLESPVPLESKEIIINSPSNSIRIIKQENQSKNSMIYSDVINNSGLSNSSIKFLSKQRCIPDHVLSEFNIRGIDNGYEIRKCLQNKYSDKELIDSGLFKLKDGNLRFLFNSNVIVYPHYSESKNVEYLSYRYLNTNLKSYNLPRVSRKLFKGNITDDSDIILFEGILDGLSYLALTNNRNFIATLGTQFNMNKIVEAYPDSNFVLAMDNDKSGLDKTEEICSNPNIRAVPFDYMKFIKEYDIPINHLIPVPYDNPIDWRDWKDFNDLLYLKTKYGK
jgi:DNA primase